MILNHSKTIRSVISLLCIFITVSQVEHSRDITLLIVILCTTPAGFSTFYRAMVPTLVENSKYFWVLVC